MKYLIPFLVLFCFGNIAIPQRYWQQEVKYTIDVRLDDATHQLHGFEQFEYTNNSPDTLQKMYIHLWPNAYRDGKTALGKQQYKDGKTNLTFGDKKDKGAIDSLDFKLEGKPVRWEYDKKNPDICVLYFASPLFPGKKITVSTPFRVQIPSGNISRLGHIEQSYQITQWYPKPAVYDKNGWQQMPYLNQGEFYSEFGSFDVSITLPSNYVVGATGDLQTETEIEFLKKLAEKTAKELPQILAERDTTRLNVKTPFPVSDKTYKTLRYRQDRVHDFAWFADKRFAVLYGVVELPYSERLVSTWAMFVPENVSTWQHAIEYMNDGVFYYSKWNGDYPYNTVTAVDGTISAGGGMEYPTITVIGNTSNKEELEVVIVHEIGHNWFYGILGSNERKHGWMDEGLNTMNEVRYIQTKYPDNTRLSDMILNGIFHFDCLSHHDMSDMSYRTTAILGLDQPVETSSEQFTPSNYGTIMYMKTGLLFTYLKSYLGDELYDTCMRAYFEEWKFKHPQPEDLRNTLERVSGKNLGWLFEDLIQTTKHIDYKIKRVQTRNAGTRVTVINKGQVNSPVSISAFKDTIRVETVWIEPGKRKTQVMLQTANVDLVQIDPNKQIPELYRANNTWNANRLLHKVEPLKLEFLIGDNEIKKTNLFWTPAMAYNVHDKLMAGIAIHNMGIAPNKFNYLVAPMFSFGRGRISGISELSYTFLPVNVFKLSRFGLSVKSFKMDTLYNTVNPGVSSPRKNDGAYLALSPYWHAKFKNKQNKPLVSSLLVQGILKYSNYQGYQQDYFGGFAQYSLDVKTPDHVWNFAIRNTLISGATCDLGRITVSSNYQYRYLKNKMKRWMEIRAFVGNTYLFNLHNPNANTSPFAMALSGSSGAQDLFFEEYFMNRGGNEGFSSQQRQEDMGNFKINTNIGTTKWLGSANFYAQLPIPRLRMLGIFADLGMYGTNTSVQTAFNTGIGLRLGKVAGVYFPIWANKELQNALTGTRYSERIRFTLRMNLVNSKILFKPD
jgi:hypothetical protein